jgi:hypothetical protein
MMQQQQQQQRKNNAILTIHAYAEHLGNFQLPQHTYRGVETIDKRLPI